MNMSMKTFKDIIAWQKGYVLTLRIYQLTAHFSHCEEFGLKSQLRRAAVSVISDIAEGFKRRSKKDQLHFYNQAQSSIEEIKCQVLLARDLEYLKPNEFQEVDALAVESARILYAWISSQK